MGQKEGEAESAAPQVFADLMGKFQQQAAKPGSHSFRQGDAAGILEGEPIFLANALDGPHLGFFVRPQEAEEPIALHGTQLGRREGLR